jgi:hypothetical protein
MASDDWRPDHPEQAVNPSSTGLSPTLLAEWSDLTDTIRRLTRTVDLAWQDARLVGAPAGTLVALGEASHGLHRVLITLRDSVGDTNTADSHLAWG